MEGVPNVSDGDYGPADSVLVGEPNCANGRKARKSSRKTFIAKRTA
jgi:hypothetical protein